MTVCRYLVRGVVEATGPGSVVDAGGDRSAGLGPGSRSDAGPGAVAGSDAGSDAGPGAGPGVTVGEFLVLRLEGEHVTGFGGAFHSEGYRVRGVIEGDRALLEASDPYRPDVWSTWELAWDAGAGAPEGWQPVSLERMRALSGGLLPLEGDPCA
jgi:hypothetical protein